MMRAGISLLLFHPPKGGDFQPESAFDETPSTVRHDLCHGLFPRHRTARQRRTRALVQVAKHHRRYGLRTNFARTRMDPAGNQLRRPALPASEQVDNERQKKQGMKNAG
jgi:hypothetical protein